MQNSEVIWHVLRHNHCSYMSKIEYNVNEICNRSSCPPANNCYATIREDKGETDEETKTDTGKRGRTDSARKSVKDRAAAKLKQKQKVNVEVEHEVAREGKMVFH